VVKSATPATLTRAGQTVTYSFLVTNTGNVTLKNATVDEGAFTGTGALSSVTCPALASSLAPGASVTCTATYTVTQADVNAGSISNSATATGTPLSGVPPVSPPSTTTVAITPAPGIAVVKSASPSDEASFTVGQVITYSFVISNTGNTTLTNVTPTEGTFTGSNGPLATVCPAGAASLAPGAQVTCTASYTLTQADVDAGSVTNTATATGTPPSGNPPVSPPSTVTIPEPAQPAVTVHKTANTQTVTTAGQVVTYSFLVTNTGNVTLTDAKPIEGTFSGTGSVSTPTCPTTAASLAPGQSVTCTATYSVTAADINAGHMLANTATATAVPPDGTAITSDPSTVDLPSPAVPAVTAPLAYTGMDFSPTPFYAAALLLMLGAALLFARRRRRRRN
jgi:LPXTG-motif cell wall-anchored protein